MKNINDLHITGRVVQDPVIKDFKDHQMIRLRIAFPNANKKSGDGFGDVVMWDSLAKENLSLKKGNAVEIFGEIEYREWEKDDIRCSKIEIKANKLIVL